MGSRSIALRNPLLALQNMDIGIVPAYTTKLSDRYKVWAIANILAAAQQEATANSLTDTGVLAAKFAAHTYAGATVDISGGISATIISLNSIASSAIDNTAGSPHNISEAVFLVFTGDLPEYAQALALVLGLVQFDGTIPVTAYTFVSQLQSIIDANVITRAIIG